MSLAKLKAIHQSIDRCRACPKMCGTPVHGPAIISSIMLMGQAPGPHESSFGKPFAYTSGKTLFKWIAQAHINEEAFRANIYIAAVARCFPGKNGKGDREPDLEEIKNCRVHLEKEVNILQPKLILAVGRLAISEVLGPKVFSKNKKLSDVVGMIIKTSFHGHEVEVICFPHPSGVSRWPHSEEGKVKLAQALDLLADHKEWKKIIANSHHHFS